MFDGVTKYFQFTVLPFGLSVGPYIFSKVMRPLVKYWRSKAIRIVVYLDDGISVVPQKAVRGRKREKSECRQMS